MQLRFSGTLFYFLKGFRMKYLHLSSFMIYPNELLLDFAVAAHEAVNATGSVHKFVFTCVERV